MNNPPPKECPRCGHMHYLPGPYCSDCCDKRAGKVDEGWTNTPPTEPGYYWAIPWASRGDQPEVVRYLDAYEVITCCGISKPFTQDHFRLWHPDKIEEPPR